MQLAYMDDSGTRDKGNPFQTMTTVIVPDDEFFGMEILMKVPLKSSSQRTLRDLLKNFMRLSCTADMVHSRASTKIRDSTR